MKKTSPCHDSVIIYENQHVELTLQYVLLTIYIHIYNSKPLGVVQSLFCRQQAAFVWNVLINTDFISTFLVKAPNGFELYLNCCSVMLLLLIIYTYIYIKH